MQPLLPEGGWHPSESHLALAQSSVETLQIPRLRPAYSHLSTHEERREEFMECHIEVDC